MTAPATNGIVKLIFFFSSRSRHTRWPRHWSSDVCSSDLIEPTQLILESVLHTLVTLHQGGMALPQCLKLLRITLPGCLKRRYLCLQAFTPLALDPLQRIK